MSLWDYIKEQMLKHPAQLVGEKDSFLTYEQLVIYAECLAKQLSGETLCAIYCGSEMASAMALLGCFAAGVTAVPLSERYEKAHTQKILQQCSPSCLITDMTGELEVYHIGDSEPPMWEMRPAVVMWTSGTTGVPKGAMLSDRNVMSNVKDIAAYFAMGHSDTILIARPLYHCAVLTGEFLTGLVKGARIVFCSERFDPSVLMELLQQQKVTVFCSTPTLLHLLSRLIRRNSDLYLKHIVVSGECMGESVGREIRRAFPDADIYHVYGLTEACPRVSYLPAEYFDQAPDHVGIPLASVTIEIRDDAGYAVENGESGMLWVRGENVMQGYYNAPELTKEKLRDGWLCTGDIAVISENGWLKILGRSDDLIIRAGMNIYPQEIEAEMKKDLRTEEVLVYGYEHPTYGTQIAMEIAGNFRDETEVRQLCLKVLPSFQVPAKIKLLEHLPKSGSGKVVRRQYHVGI